MKTINVADGVKEDFVEIQKILSAKWNMPISQSKALETLLESYRDDMEEKELKRKEHLENRTV